jgi:hypothetical protein
MRDLGIIEALHEAKVVVTRRNLLVHCSCELKLKNVLQCYSVEHQRLIVLHGLLHAVTSPQNLYKRLITNNLQCYIIDTDLH